MAAISTQENFEIHRNEDYLKIADKFKPELIHKEVVPKRIVILDKNEKGDTNIISQIPYERMEERHMKKGDRVCLDFGNHYVGYIHFRVQTHGSHQDAPAFLKLKFAEMPGEITDDINKYDGWISRGWIQEEILHIDILPAEIKLPRRYAFRYLQIEVLDTSLKFQVSVEDVKLDAVSAVDASKVTGINSGDELLDKIDEVSIYTLQECMQEVFEDGPKRDRRLWLGDFMLQARANYVSYKNYNLVKRCLYLFGGLTFNNDQISACLFMEPEKEPDDTYLWDYALFFVPTLVEYFEETGDIETVRDLYKIAMKQIDNCLEELDVNHIVKDKGDIFWCFADWAAGLNKQAIAQAILIYSMKYGVRLATIMEQHVRVEYLKEKIDLCTNASLKFFWDREQNMFVSGTEKQISWATQVWMILAGVIDKEEGSELMLRTRSQENLIPMVTPYMFHHYVEALIQCDLRNLALEEIKYYWGNMILDGADTFWELYNPENKKESPYGSNMVNSYCHAWSCTPTYLLRKEFEFC